MRIRRRSAVILAVAAAGALAVTGIALAATDGNSSTVTFSFSPNKVPKKKFKAGALKFHTHTDFGAPPPGATIGVHRVQLFIDHDIKLNNSAAPKCNQNAPPFTSANVTMAQAMAACSKAKIGSGSAAAITAPGPVQGCVLDFNGKPQGGRPVVLLFTRTFAPGQTKDCSNPASNNHGSASILLKGIVKPATGRYRVQLDVNNIDTATPPGAFLTDFISRIRKGNFVSARCHNSDHKWKVKGIHTYTDSQTDTDNVSQKCKVS